MTRPYIAGAAKASHLEAADYHLSRNAGNVDAATFCAVAAARKQIKASHRATSDDLRAEHRAQAADWCDTAARLLRGEPEPDAEVTVGELRVSAARMLLAYRVPPKLLAEALLISTDDAVLLCAVDRWLEALTWTVYRIHAPRRLLVPASHLLDAQADLEALS